MIIKTMKDYRLLYCLALNVAYKIPRFNNLYDLDLAKKVPIFLCNKFQTIDMSMLICLSVKMPKLAEIRNSFGKKISWLVETYM